MKSIQLLTVLIVTVFSLNAWAYGSSSSKKACSKPKLTEFSPPHLSVVAPQSEFSFHASSLTNPESIAVSVKKEPVQVSIQEKNNAYVVSGKLPVSLQGTYARVNINATGTNSCKVNEGWLLKIESTKP